MLDNIGKYFEIYKGTPLFGREKSVHYNKKNPRTEKAGEQATLKPVSVEVICSHVNDLLKSIGMKIIESPIVKQPCEIDYEKIHAEYGTTGKTDIVWMKFTKDQYLGVVASGNDVNFDMPSSELQYNEEEWNSKRYGYIWKYTTSGILIHQLGKEWDTSFVLVFPLVDIPSGKNRFDIERAIGNYLIAKGVPILDFYSHNY